MLRPYEVDENISRILVQEGANDVRVLFLLLALTISTTSKEVE